MSTPRFLTPHKIGLLALTVIYTDSVVPGGATIPILSFLASQLLSASPDSQEEQYSTIRHDADAGLQAIEHVTCSHASAIPGRTVWDLLLNRLWKIDSLDAFHGFFEFLPLLIHDRDRDEDANLMHNVKDTNPNRMRLARNAPLGGFARRAHLEFTRLQFSDGVELWQKFKDYRAPSFAQWKKRNPLARVSSSGENRDISHIGHHVFADLTVGTDTSSQKTIVSTDDIEKLLEFQIHQIQSMQAAPHTVLKADRGRDGYKAAARAANAI